MPLLFISYEKHLDAAIPGGVQVCTKEYIELLNEAGFELYIKPISFTKNLIKRLKIKLKIDVYEGYDFKAIAKDIISIIREKNIQVLALNQVSLIGLAPYIRRVFGSNIKILILSHGNESGDFLHQIVLQQKHSVWSPLRQWRLGAFLAKESNHFRNDIDAVLCLSETEQQINNWLGAKRTFFIPRTYKPNFLPWSPVKGRVGFVGTLDHLPNYEGLKYYLDELKNVDSTEVRIRIVGGPSNFGTLLQRRYSFVDYLGRLDNVALEEEASTWNIFLNPIFWFSRGASTKLAQGINWGLPIITTPAGNRGYRISDQQLITVYSAKEMAEKTIQYLADYKQLIVYAQNTREIATNGPAYHQLKDLIFSELLKN